MTQAKNITIRQARTKDVWRISELMDPLVAKRILLGKDKVVLFESVPEFLVAEDERGSIIGYGALHVLWEHLGEIRTLGVSDEARGTGVGHLLLEALEERAQQFGLTQLFCLTFEVNFLSVTVLKKCQKTTRLSPQMCMRNCCGQQMKALLSSWILHA